MFSFIKSWGSAKIIENEFPLRLAKSSRLRLVSKRYNEHRHTKSGEFPIKILHLLLPFFLLYDRFKVNFYDEISTLEEKKLKINSDAPRNDELLLALFSREVFLSLPSRAFVIAFFSDSIATCRRSRWTRSCIILLRPVVRLFCP